MFGSFRRRVVSGMSVMAMAAALPVRARVPARAPAADTTRALRGDGLMPDDAQSRPPREPSTTIELLSQAQAGDDAALNALFRRCTPPLRRWARGRLPGYARDLLDTQDLVQDTVLHVLGHLKDFHADHNGAIHAYLRIAVLNRIRDEIRRHHRHGLQVELDDNQASHDASPLEQAIGREGVERYEAALQRLRPQDREAIVGRLELQYGYKELALILGKPSADAARIAVTRALGRLLPLLRHGD